MSDSLKGESLWVVESDHSQVQDKIDVDVVVALAAAAIRMHRLAKEGRAAAPDFARDPSYVGVCVEGVAVVFENTDDWFVWSVDSIWEGVADQLRGVHGVFQEWLQGG